MIIRKIQVENWRNTLAPLAIELSDGINVLHGNNGQGKSTLVEALRMGFFDRHGISGEEVRKIRPWGCDLSPRVEIEFDHDTTQYRLVKQFLSGKLAALERKSGSGWERYKDGDAADEWCRNIFKGETPGRGLAKIEHLGLARILWIPQGTLNYGGLSESVRSMLSGNACLTETAAPAGNRIDAVIHQKFLKFFTEKGTDRTTSGSIAELRKNLDTTRSRLAEMQEKLQRMLRVSQSVSELQLQIDEYGRQAVSLRESIAGLTEKSRHYQAERLVLEQAMTKKTSLESTRDSLTNRISGIQEAAAHRNSLNQKSAALTSEILERTATLADAQRRLDSSRMDLGRLQKEEELIAQDKRKADDAAAYHACIESLKALRQKEFRIRELECRIAAANEAIGKLRAPSQKEITKLRTAAAALTETTIELKASQLSVEFTASQELTWITCSGEPAGARELKPGDSLTISGIGHIAAELQSIGTMKFSGPVQESSEKLVRKIAAQQKVIDEIAAIYGSCNPDVLQDRLSGATIAVKDIENCKDHIAQVLDGLAFDDLARKVASFAAVQTDLEQRYATWSSIPPDGTRLMAELAEAQTAFQNRRQHAHEVLTQAQSEQVSLSERCAQCKRDLEEVNAGIGRWTTRQSELENGATQELLREELQETLGALHCATAEFEGAKGRLAAYAGDPSSQCSELTQKLAGLEELNGSRRDQMHALSGELSSLGGMGVYSQVAELEELVRSAEQQIRTLETEAGGINLLWNTLQHVRHEFQQKFSSPVETRAGQLFYQINGRREGAVRFNAQFEVAGFIPQGLPDDTLCDTGNLSGGEQEQLFLAIRLALAEQLFVPGTPRHLIVLDDFLTATDDARLARIKNLVQTMVGQFQILILTCHPERYMGLHNAHLVGLNR